MKTKTYSKTIRSNILNSNTVHFNKIFRLLILKNSIIYDLLDIFEDFVSPVNAARQLVYQVASKRKQMLEQAMVFCMQVLQNPQLEPRQKDGILHIVGAVAPVLLKKNVYKDQVEAMLVSYVFPEFQSPHGFLRARVRIET